MSCPFCGAEKIVQQTPYISLGRSGEYEPKTTFCCVAQSKNQQYIKKRFDPKNGDQPSVEETSEW